MILEFVQLTIQLYIVLELSSRLIIMINYSNEVIDRKDPQMKIINLLKDYMD